LSSLTLVNCEELDTGLSTVIIKMMHCDYSGDTCKNLDDVPGKTIALPKITLPGLTVNGDKQCALVYDDSYKICPRNIEVGYLAISNVSCYNVSCF